MNALYTKEVGFLNRKCVIKGGKKVGKTEMEELIEIEELPDSEIELLLPDLDSITRYIDTGYFAGRYTNKDKRVKRALESLNRPNKASERKSTDNCFRCCHLRFCSVDTLNISL